MLTTEILVSCDFNNTTIITIIALFLKHYSKFSMANIIFIGVLMNGRKILEILKMTENYWMNKIHVFFNTERHERLFFFLHDEVFFFLRKVSRKMFLEWNLKMGTYTWYV